MGKNIIVELTNERIIPSGGLAVVGAILGKKRFRQKLQQHESRLQPSPASDKER